MKYVMKQFSSWIDWSKLQRRRERSETFLRRKDPCTCLGGTAKQGDDMLPEWWSKMRLNAKVPAPEAPRLCERTLGDILLGAAVENRCGILIRLIC